MTIPFRWGYPITNHLLPHHNARMVYDMAIYHHATIWGVTIPFRWDCATTALCYHIIVRRGPYHSDGVRHAISGNYGME